MKQYNVTGMSCAACSARVEKAVRAVSGVENCSVSLLTNSMGVEGSASEEEIIAAVVNAGYGASPKSSDKRKNSPSYDEQSEALEDKESPKLRNRLLWSLGFLLVLMYFSMGHMMWGFPLPEFFNGNHIAMGLTELLLAAIVMVINQRFFINGFKGIIHGSPNMDTLVALGSSVSFIWSVYALYAMTGAQLAGNEAAVMEYMNEFYFESAAMILSLITVGKMLEARSKGRTTDALKSLMKLAPKTAVIIENGEEREIPIEELSVGDIFVVRPGASIPVDGKVTEGSAAVDESALTGESIPVDKAVGDTVSAATINKSGYMRCRATRVGEDTSLAQIIKTVSDAAATKAPIAKIADKVSGVFVPAVISIATVTTIIWLLAGQSIGFALARGISVLVISCPCALGLATPVAIMVGSGIGAKSGILFKTAVSLEQTGKMQIVALDKTGTVTNGTPVVTDILPVGIEEDELLQLAASLESKSEHPLARAVMQCIAEKGTVYPECEDFKSLAGNGLSGKLEGRSIYAGSVKYISSAAMLDEETKNKAEELSSQGKTPLLFAKGKKVAGIIAVADTVKEDSAKAVAQLKNMGLRVIMLTGDNERTAKAIAVQAGIDEVVAGVMPDGKERVIRRLKKQGGVIMVGDGINDAPALTRADIGIAIGAGADIAIDAADLVLVKSRLIDVPAAIRLSRKTLTNIRENLFWAFFYNVICIPLAAGAFISLLGWKLNPMVGAAAMSLSSFCVVSNALRLNLSDIYNPAHDKKVKQPQGIETEEILMTKTIKIDGMMCHHCEAHVKKALEAITGVTEATADFGKNTAVVTLDSEVDNAVLTAAVTDAGYEVLGIE